MGGRAGGGAATCCGAANVGPRRAERRGRDGVRGPAGVPSGRRAGAGRRQPRESARGGGGGTADLRRAACAADALSAPRGRRPRRWRGRRNCAERSGRCEPGPRSAPLRTFAGAGYKMAVMPSRSGGGSALPLLLAVLLGSAAACPDGCVCDEERLRCGGLGLPEVPRELSPGLRHVNLSYNKLTEIDPSAFAELLNLQEVQLNNNELTAIPSLGPAASNVRSLHLHHNRIRSIEASQLKPYVALETLDLSFNDITEIRNGCFPQGLHIKELYLGSNRISTLEPGAFDSLSRSLLTLRLSKNRITQLPVKAFRLPRLTQLELNRNRIRLIEGLTFQGLDSLEVLKLQRNNISKLTDGAFWGLAKMQVLHLDYNSLTEVNSGSLYGLSSLHQLHLSNNSISRINPDGWSFCQKLHELILSYNNLTRLDEGSLADLGGLHVLRLSHNSINHIAEGAFKGLKNLRVLELDHNDISGTIEDTNGAFTGLENLSKLTLFGNKIKSVAKKAFSGLEALEHLNLGDNAIRSIQADAFAKMKSLRQLHINSDSFLCDCQLKWLPPWLLERELQSFVVATCAHPESLKSKSIFAVLPESFVCDDFPKPQIIIQPETTVAVLGKDIRFTCSAASSSSSPMMFAWKKDNEVLHNAEIENFAHVRAKDGEVMEYTTILHLRHVTFAHEGRYQCIITNHFGSTYSNKARLTVNVLPSFIKTPHDITSRTGTTARLECAAEGHPPPQIAWQKDGGTDFPAARERRMHVMPDDDVFFITDVKIEDMGVYSCTAQNSAGSVLANATLTVLETPSLIHPLEDHVVSVGETVALQCKATGSPPPRITWLKGDQPLIVTERHHFTSGNQLLVVRNVVLEDAGKYTCEMSNTLGTERAHSHVSILQSLGCRKDRTTVGIITIAVVCSIVLTSLVWVCIIYQTRKKSEEYSVTNTDETIVPPDVPSYLSSQGTLSDRQEAVVRGDNQHPNGHIDSNDGSFVTGMCQTDAGRCPDVEAPTVGCRQPKLCIGYNKDTWKTEDTADGMLVPDKTGYGLPVVCTDCSGSTDSMNIHIYPGEAEYYAEGLQTLDSSYHNALSSKERSRQRGAGTTSLLHPQQCNGIASGKRMEADGTLYPSNHDRITPVSTTSPLLADQHGSSQSGAKPSELNNLNLVRASPAGGSLKQLNVLPEIPPTLLDLQSEAEAKQALLANGFTPTSCDSSHAFKPPSRSTD
ncbi:leucine-rich repeats and immunoglobulin-like domains protein 1 isoform X4 [Gallus gallus]|uniref:leucine-rich repeats and immunoglobulin-like domains protein 1 isoform X4 n=1 Tax=Gallus gallus TaxID=9031 RepID=UPI001AEA08F0|nr:leucine-rich repeats and immunoglobulin-like domains protein 1 isoform X4 [Gallus gallus]